jgi:predicted amidohydrolase
MTPASTGRPQRERLIVAAAQTGPMEPGTTREAIVARLVTLLEDAARRGAELVVFTEVALTPFFPHWWIDDEQEIDSYCERSFPNDSIAALTETARSLGVAFHIGYAELAEEGGRTQRFNAAMLFGPDGSVVGKYRKIHLPGYHDVKPDHPFQNLEKRYFEVGDLGLPVWDLLGTRIGMSICNDRRWPETYRILGLQGAELVLIGYNTPRDNPALPETDRLADFHNHLSMQSGAYQNGFWIVGTAKAGTEAGVEQIGGSCIISPSGELVAVASSLGDEVVVAEIDLVLARRYKERLLDLGRNRQPQTYGAITEVADREA